MTDACPVCAERLSGRPERCFRCETPLGGWWRFDAAVDGLSAAAGDWPARPHRPAGLLVAGAIGAGLAAVAVFVLFARDAQAPGGAPSLAPAPSAATAAPIAGIAPVPTPAPALATPQPSVLRYRVQRGDSPWRIAAALTGDGRRWRELFPRKPRLVAGQWIEVPAPRP